MKPSASLVTYEEEKEPSFFVGEWLLKRGFGIVSSIYDIHDYESDTPSNSNQYCILGTKPPVKKILGLFPYQPDREFLGMIWFNNSAVGTTKETWIFEANIVWLQEDKTKLKKLKNLIEEMAHAFQTRIHFRERTW